MQKRFKGSRLRDRVAARLMERGLISDRPSADDLIDAVANSERARLRTMRWCAGALAACALWTLYIGLGRTLGQPECTAATAALTMPLDDRLQPATLNP